MGKINIENILIKDIGGRGKGVGQSNGKVLFVDDTVPGDVVDVEIYKNKKDYAFARPIGFRKKAPERTHPFCQHFNWCGGCKWQFLDYEQQLAFKAHLVKTAFERIGKLAFPEPLPILPAEKTRYYRNKLEFTFSNKRWLTPEEVESGTILQRDGLGFHVRGRFDKVVDVRHCFLQPEPSNAIRDAVREYAIRNALSFFDIRQQQGFLRNLVVRTSSLGEVLVLLAVFAKNGRETERESEHREHLLDHLIEKFPQLTSLNYTINPKKNESYANLEVANYHGRDHIMEQLGDLKFKIGPKSFFQTNTEQAAQLYQVVLDFAAFTGNEMVYDLYTGVGSIALSVARHCRKVVGIEAIPAAIADARENACLNAISNCTFQAGDVRQLLTPGFVDKAGRPDVLLADPPRAGMHKNVIKTISEMQPKKIVYVSCNPATQARDLQLLDERYRVEKIQPVDLFPHTVHVENVALLIAK